MNQYTSGDLFISFPYSVHTNTMKQMSKYAQKKYCVSFKKKKKTNGIFTCSNSIFMQNRNIEKKNVTAKWIISSDKNAGCVRLCVCVFMWVCALCWFVISVYRTSTIPPFDDDDKNTFSFHFKFRE